MERIGLHVHFLTFFTHKIKINKIVSDTEYFGVGGNHVTEFKQVQNTNFDFLKGNKNQICRNKYCISPEFSLK